MEENREKIILLLKNKLAKIPDLLLLNHGTSAYRDGQFEDWRKSVLRLLEQLTGDKDSSYVKDFYNINFSPTSIETGMSDYEFEKVCEEAFEKGLKTAQYILHSIIEEFEILNIQINNQQTIKNNGININLNQNQTQFQSINLNIKDIFKNQLSNEQLNELENIVKEKDKNKFQKFLESLGIGLSVEMLKTLMLSIFF